MKKLLTTVLFFQLFLLAKTVTGTNYYFSSSTGDDSRTSTQAQNPATPWKTINKLNSFFSSLGAGDTVFFKRGEEFQGSIIISKSGTASAFITISAYGTGMKPVISGFNTVSEWVNLGNGIWESTNAESNLTSLNMLTIDGIQYGMGRYPKTTAANGGYLTYTSHINNTSITGSSLPSNLSSLPLGQVVIRKNRWTIDRCAISAIAGPTITYITSSYQPPNNGFGYFIQNHENTLLQSQTTFGEWYFNPITKKIRIYFGTHDPSSYTIKIATTTDLLTASAKSYLSFDNIRFEGANRYGLYLPGTGNIKIQNCEVVWSGDIAINSYPGSTASNVQVLNSMVSWANNYGILLPNNNNSLIQRNTLKNIGSIVGAAGDGDDSYEGIKIIGSDNIIEYNIFDTVGSKAIRFEGGTNNIIRNNFIHYTNFVSDDAGAIYTYEGDASSSRSGKIQNNIISKVAGARNGTPNDGGNILAIGIYLDNRARDIEISGNTVFDCYGPGIFLHDATDIQVLNNTLYNNGTGGYWQMWISQDNTTDPPTRNIVNQGNIFFSKSSSSTQYVAEYKSISNDVNQFGASAGDWDNNFYCRPLNEPLGINSTNSGLGGTIHTGFTNKYYSVDQWKLVSPLYDAHSSRTPVQITDVNDLKFEYNATSSARVVNLGATYIDVAGVSYPGTITLQPYTSAVLIYGSGTITNQPPAADAGISQILTLPVSVVVLNGSNSTDEDGTIVAYSWSKISGPASALILSPNLAVTNITSLIAGVYQFELKVTDNDGAVDRDTLTITINAAPINQPPVANAGNNSTIALPTNSVTLSGAGNDVDGNVISYQWNKITGPDQYIINAPTEAQTVINDLTQGVYIFELIITDNENAIGRDSVQVTVNAAEVADTADKYIKVNIYGGENPYDNPEWNNWNVSASLTSSAFNYQDGAVSGVTAKLNVGRVIIDNSPDFGGEMAPAEVLRYASYTNRKRTLTISGLSTSKTYNLELYASVNSSLGYPTVFKIGQSTYSVITTNNLSNAVTFVNILPNAQGQIIIYISATFKSSNYLNGFIIKENNNTDTSQAGASATKLTQQVATEKTTSIDNKGSFKIYPVPVTNNFTLEVNNSYTGKMKVEILDQSGKIIHQFGFNKEQQASLINLSASDLSAGIYYIKVQIGDWMETRKLLKL